MLAWEVLIVAVLAAVLLLGTLLLRRCGPGTPLVSFRRTANPRLCAATRSRRPPGWRPRTVKIRPLPSALRAHYAGAYRSMEAAFSTTPQAALKKLDVLVTEILRHCGYPVDTFEHDVTTIQPCSPRVVEDYRTAHSIALGNDNGMASEPDLRLAMFHYRSLLETLLEDDGPGRLAESSR